MPIVDRDLDVSERKVLIHQYIQGTGGGTFLPGTSTGQTYVIANMPFPFEVVSAASSARGSSGSPLMNLQIYRFIPGTGGGATMFGNIFQSFAVSLIGTSGINSAMPGTVTGWSLISSSGATLNQGIAGDSLVFVQTGANAALTEVTLSVVVKKLQDIVSHYGTST